MKRTVISRRAIAIAAGLVLLLWLFCLPGRMFDHTPYSTVVTARGGELLGARVAADGQWRFPPCDSLPEKFERAVIEYEDRTFYSHCGISLRGLARALKQNLANGRIVSGGSTISMQTIRLERQGRRTFGEKLIEMFMATRLEARYSKKEILSMYASHAPFGGNVVGLEAAMWRYLGSNGSEMSWAEAATLAVLQNAPSMIHLSKNRRQLLAKRNRLLGRLYEKGELTADEYHLALEEPLIGRPYPMPRVAPHLVESLNLSARGQLARTDIDYSLQTRIEALTAHWRNELALSGINDLAAMVVEVASGKVIAYCGNADIDAERPGQWVDIAASPRSSGSILKPLLYCAALQEGVILENTLLPDIPTDFGGFAPKNFDGEFGGVVGAASALAQSLNVPNVWLLKEFGVGRFASLLQRCGFTTLTRPADSYGLSLILGGAEVTLRDVVGCYAHLARFDSQFPLCDSVAVYSMLNAMREVNRPDLLDWTRASSVQNVAWKTGTSYGGRDGWAIGLTPRYAVGVWVGNANGSRIADLTGARCAGPVMFDIFDLLPASGWFKRPNGRTEKVCSRSGMLAGKYCRETTVEPVGSNAAKSPRCHYCVEIPVSLDGRRRVVNASEPSRMESYFLLPPVHKFYYKRTHADYAEPPASEGEVKIIYPADGAVIMLPRKSDGTRSTLICKAVDSNPGAEIFWHLDNTFVGATTDLHQLRLSPRAGFHRLTLCDSSGNSATTTFVVH